MTGQSSDSSVWDIQDCAPVLTQEQVEAVMARSVSCNDISWMTKMLARLDRLIASAEQIKRWKHANL